MESRPTTPGDRTSTCDEFVEAIRADLAARGYDPDAILAGTPGSALGPPPPPEVRIPTAAAELGDEVNILRLMLADDTLWLEGDPAVDPVEWRRTTVEVLCRQLGRFLEPVAPP